MKYILTFLLPIIAFSQNYKTTNKDFNNDGDLDTLESYYDGGSSFGGTYVTLINGKTKDTFKLNSFGCFCDIKETILIPPKLMEDSNKPFLDAIKKELLPEKWDTPEASLQWLITSNMNYKKLKDNTYFDLIINTPPKWISGEIKLPKTYYIDVKGETLDKLFFTNGKVPDWYNPLTTEGWLIYYGHNHFRNKNENGLLMIEKSPAYKVFKSSQGVILKKDNSYAWLFVADYGITGSPEKLRRDAIGKLKLVNNYIIIQLTNSLNFSNPIFIIDIEKGITVRLNDDEDYKKIYKIEKDEIIIETTLNTKSYLLKDLFKELNKIEL
ncbi:hypothetical protein [uncultured Formosa sp.]|uniref:hypothetical protein n=1 Tax=uncultured Formosa sp. TaxID=255435 RepID=UPI002626F294|nr:hypothetical protein [uncultured Formosa sp.]